MVIGTVFQIFLIDTLAARKEPGKLTKDDWKNIAEKVADIAILEDGQSYSEFVFTLYADYIDISAKAISKGISKKSLAAIKGPSTPIPNQYTAQQTK